MKVHSFRNKILLALILTVAVLTGLTLVVMTFYVRSEILRRTETELHQARSIFRSQQTQRFQKSEEICSRLVGSRRLAAALEEGDVRVLLGVAQNEQEISKLGQTFLAITDRNGKSLVRASNGEFTSQLPAGPLPEEEFVQRAIHEKTDKMRGYFVKGNQLFEGLCVSVRTGEELLGRIVVAFEVTDQTAQELAIALGYRPVTAVVRKLERKESQELSTQDVEVGFMVEDTIVASTFDTSVRRGIEPLLKQRGKEEQAKITWEAVPYIAFVSSLTRGSGTPASQVILISQRSLRELLGTLRHGALVCGLVTITLCIWVSTWIARGISAPVSDISDAAREIRKGNLQIRVKRRSSDELGNLADTFNEMADGLQLKEKYRGVLDKVVSPEVADELLSGKIELGGELKSVTVLFSDIRGFTSMTENMKPREILEMLNEHMTAMTEIVRRHGGIVDKFVGDQVMAVFGAPKSTGADARAALRAAVEMRTKRREMNQFMPPKRQIELGFGINTGEVVAGNMGSDKQLSYTVLGPTVNLAVRLCGVARPMQILATQPTIIATGEDVVAKPLGPVKAKGFTEPVHVFEVGNVT